MKAEGVEYSIAKLKLMSVLYFLFSHHIVISRPPQKDFFLTEEVQSATT